LGAATVGVVMSAAPASALGITPVPGGYQVDLTHSETVWVNQNNIGRAAAGLPHPSAASFGQTLGSVASVAADYPQGRVSFTVFGPLNTLNGTMVAYKD
jgi:hypothetical protein